MKRFFTVFKLIISVFSAILFAVKERKQQTGDVRFPVKSYVRAYFIRRAYKGIIHTSTRADIPNNVSNVYDVSLLKLAWYVITAEEVLKNDNKPIEVARTSRTTTSKSHKRRRDDAI